MVITRFCPLLLVQNNLRYHKQSLIEINLTYGDRLVVGMCKNAQWCWVHTRENESIYNLKADKVRDRLVCILQTFWLIDWSQPRRLRTASNDLSKYTQNYAFTNKKKHAEIGT